MSKSYFLKFLCREPTIWLSAKKSVSGVFFLRVFLLALGKQASLLGVFYLTLGKAFFAESFLFGSRQIHEL
jgi:hypothetical protein